MLYWLYCTLYNVSFSALHYSLCGSKFTMDSFIFIVRVFISTVTSTLQDNEVWYSQQGRKKSPLCTYGIISMFELLEFFVMFLFLYIEP